MRALIAVYERYVSRYPEQWLILHRYWREDSPGSAKSSSVSGTS